MSKILVTGATGPLGKSTVEFLLAKGVDAQNISILVRDTAKANDLKEQGITVIEGNYDNYASLVTAFTGINKLFFVSGNDIFNRIPQHENVVNAAKETGIKHFVYASSERVNETSTSPIALITEAHVKTEDWIKASGIPYTFLKNNLYIDLVPYLTAQAVESGVVYYPSGLGKAGMALRTEMAEAAAVTLTEEGHENKAYFISNSEGYSYQDVANELAEITGKPIQFISPSVEEYKGAMINAGVPEAHVQMFLGMALAQEQGEFSKTSEDLEKLIGRKPMTLKAYLSAVYAPID